MHKLKLSYWVGKYAVKLHYKDKLDIWALCSLHEPELFGRGQRKARIQTRTRWAVWRRDNFTCVYCLAWGNNLSLDHVIPESHGGDASEDNLITACSSCNRKKSDIGFEEFVESPWLKKKIKQNLRTSTTQGPQLHPTLTQVRMSLTHLQERYGVTAKSESQSSQ